MGQKTVWVCALHISKKQQIQVNDARSVAQGRVRAAHPSLGRLNLQQRIHQGVGFPVRSGQELRRPVQKPGLVRIVLRLRGVDGRNRAQPHIRQGRQSRKRLLQMLRSPGRVGSQPHIGP